MCMLCMYDTVPCLVVWPPIWASTLLHDPQVIHEYHRFTKFIVLQPFVVVLTGMMTSCVYLAA